MKKLKIFERLLIIFDVSFTILFVLLTVLNSWPNWWEGIILEHSPMTWFESILLCSCFFICLGCILLNILTDDSQGIKIWTILSLGFGYLTLDERLSLHERIRDNLLAPRKVNLTIFPWTSDGDYVLLVFLLIGLLFLPLIFKLIKQRKSSFILFILALIFSASAILLDSFNFHQSNITFARMMMTLEELLETTGMLLFLNSLFLLLTYYSKELKTTYIHSKEKLDT